MAKNLVLITGATGFVGFRTLLTFLEHGYRLRIVVRSEDKADTIRNNVAVKSLNKASLFDFVVVQDLTQPGSLDAAAVGCDAIVHLASPIPRANIGPDEHLEKLIRPAVGNTLSALQAAKASGTVKRVVITSSLAAIIPVHELLPSNDPPRSVPLKGDDRPMQPEPPYSSLVGAYAVSKQKALVATDDWVKENKPTFDVVNLMPPYVIGRNYLAETLAALLNGTNGLFLCLVTGQGDASAPPEHGYSIHVDDVALAHVLAVDRQLIKTKDGIANYNLEQALDFNDVPIIAEQIFPEAFKTFLTAGTKPTKVGPSDIRKFEKDFGFTLKPVREMVASVVEQYIELVEKDQEDKK